MKYIQLLLIYVLVRPLETQCIGQNLRAVVPHHIADTSQVQNTFIAWGKEEFIPIESMQLSDNNKDLEIITQGLNKYKLLVLSEGFHNCKEMMQLHHRLIKYLVEVHGYNTIITESGLPESRVIYNYIKGKPAFNNMWETGLSKIYSSWYEGRELIEWMRKYNRSNNNELQYYGIDIGGFYNNWEPPLGTVIEYLMNFDSDYANEINTRLAPYLNILRQNARVNYTEKLSLRQQYELALILDELVEYFSKNKKALVAHSNNEDFEWVRQTAVAMQMAENYYRNITNLIGSETKKYIGLNGRELAMANNVKWVMQQRKDAKVIMINHVIHSKTSPQIQDGVYGSFTPACAFLKHELQDSMFIVGMAYGEGTYWKQWQKKEKRYIDTISPGKPDGVEQVLKEIAKENFYLQWDKPSEGADQWLNVIQELRENGYSIKIKPSEWNACIYLNSVSPANPAN